MPRRAWGAGALAALIVAVLAALGIARHHRDEARRVTRSRDAQAARDTALQELDLPAANRLAIERAQSRRFLESLPYFRRELQLLDHDVWGLHYDFATVLNDAAFEERVRRGVSVRATRGTLERAALVRESLQELDRAEASVSRRDDLARVRERRAHILWSWGFRWDGIAGYRAALSALPTSRSIPGRLEQRRAQMIDPLRAPDDESALP